MRKAGECADPQWECIPEGRSSIMRMHVLQWRIASRVDGRVTCQQIEVSVLARSSQASQAGTLGPCRSCKHLCMRNGILYRMRLLMGNQWSSWSSAWHARTCSSQVSFWFRHSAHAVGEVTGCQGDPVADCYNHRAGWSPEHEQAAWDTAGWDTTTHTTNAV